MRPSRRVLALAVSSVLMFSAAPLFADADGAKGYIKEAKALIDNKDYDGATAKLELAETEIDDLEPTAKAPLADQIKQLRATMISAQAAADKPMYQRKLDRALKDAEDAIGNLVIWSGAERQLSELLADEKLKAALPAEAAAAEKKLVTFRKLNAKKAGPQIAAQVENVVKNVETEWAEHKPKFSDPDASPNSKEGAIEDTGRAIERARQEIAKLDAEDATAKSLAARVDKLAAEFSSVALADKAKEVAARLKDKIELYNNEHEGWEKEDKATTWDEFQKQSGGDIEKFFSPRTIAWVERSGDFLKSLEENEDYKLVSADAAIKKFVDDVKAKREKAYAALLKRVQTVADAALTAPVKEDTNALSRLKDDVRLALGEASADAKAYMEKLEKKIAGHEAATTGAEEAKKQLVVTLRAKAEAEWPKLYEGMKWETEIDLSKNGQQIGFLADNLMGYRFKPGDFYFATTLGGEPVVGKIDPGIMAGIKATEAAIGRTLGDDDGDGKWDVIAVVTSKKIKLQAKKQVEATGTVDGANVKITGEYAEPVEATVIEIIAAKCGPFAGAKDRGVLKPDGTVGK